LRTEMVVAGFGEAGANGTYTKGEDSGGKSFYGSFLEAPGAIYWNAGKWNVFRYDPEGVVYESSDDVAEPDLVTTWTPVLGADPQIGTVTPDYDADVTLGDVWDAADGALKAEADTLDTVADRSATTDKTLTVGGVTAAGDVSATNVTVHAEATIPALNVGKLYDAAGTTEIYDTAMGSMDERYADSAIWEGFSANTIASNGIHTTISRGSVGRDSTNAFWITGYIAFSTNNVPKESVTNLVLEVRNASLNGFTSASYTEIPLLESDFLFSAENHTFRPDRAITNEIPQLYGRGMRALALRNKGLDIPTGGAITNVQGYLIIYSK
jgi:hypothetical protein